VAQDTVAGIMAVEPAVALVGAVEFTKDSVLSGSKDKKAPVMSQGEEFAAA
jgi:hypothetical protein